VFSTAIPLFLCHTSFWLEGAQEAKNLRKSRKNFNPALKIFLYKQAESDIMEMLQILR